MCLLDLFTNCYARYFHRTLGITFITVQVQDRWNFSFLLHWIRCVTKISDSYSYVDLVVRSCISDCIVVPLSSRFYRSSVQYSHQTPGNYGIEHWSCQIQQLQLYHEETHFTINITYCFDCDLRTEITTKLLQIDCPNEPYGGIQCCLFKTWSENLHS